MTICPISQFACDCQPPEHECDGLDQLRKACASWKAEALRLTALAEQTAQRLREFHTYDKENASTQDRIAWVLCQIIDDDAPMRWTRYRFVAGCIASNERLLADLRKLADEQAVPDLRKFAVEQAIRGKV